MRFVNVEGVLIPQHVWERAKQEQRLGVEIDPQRLSTAMNRAMRRRFAKEAKKAGIEVQDKIVAERPIRVPQPVSKSEAVDRVAQMLIEGLAAHNPHPGTVDTLKAALSEAEAKIVERAWRDGRPIPREQIRNAIEEIYKRGDAMRAAQKR